MRKTFIIKIVALIAIAAMVLTASVVMISASGSTEEAIDTASAVPSADIGEAEAPIPQTTISDKIDSYNEEKVEAEAEAEADDEGEAETDPVAGEVAPAEKRSIRIYSDEQIASLNERRANGEWYNLTAEEILYIVDDTKKLFEDYDVIEIAALDGSIKTFRGYPFYSTKEYYDSFGNGAYASYDISADLYYAILARITPLHCAVYHDETLGMKQSDVVLVGVDKNKGADKEWCDKIQIELIEAIAFNDLSVAFNHPVTGWTPARARECLPGYKAFGGFLFHKEQEIIYVPDTDADDASKNAVIFNKYSVPVLSKAVTVEVYSQETQSLVASIRLDGENDAEQVAKIESLWNSMTFSQIESIPYENYYDLSDYIAVVTLHGFEDWSDTSIKNEANTVRKYTYRPDGNINGFYFGNGPEMYQMGMQIQGLGNLNSYINSLLQEKLA